MDHDPPAIADARIQKTIEEAAERLGLKTMRLPSGAGHDAQWMARLVPMGMIFVPSVGGISHSPKELTMWQDCANGPTCSCKPSFRSTVVEVYKP